MPSRNKKSKAKQPSSNGLQSAMSGSIHAPGASGSSLRAEMEEAVKQRAGKRAARAAERASELEAQKNAGNELFKAEDYEGAVLVYLEAIDKFGGKPVLWSNLAAAYLKLEDFEEAETAATNALMYEPRMIKARYRRGLARVGMFHFRAAIIDFKAVLQQDPKQNEAREQLKLAEAFNSYADGGGPDDSSDSDCEDDAGWPEYEDTPEEESGVDSDSSDCRHGGNGFPCRFYNHEGCSRKGDCRYSHAPDDKSQRDKLGRNVCIYSLLDICKFGASKCVYSHDMTYLPPGWWDSQQMVTQLKEEFDDEEVEEFGKSDFNSFIRNLGGAPTHPSLSSDTKAASSGFAQKVVDGHGTTVKQESPASVLSEERFILLMVLDGGTTESYKQPTITALKSKIRIETAVAPSEAFKFLGSPNLAGVFVADAAISKRKHLNVLSKLVEYAKSGGYVVIGGSFSSFIRPSDLAIFSQSWGVSWTSGSYHRATFSLNKSHSLAKSNPTLPSSYSMKALHIRGLTSAVSIYNESGGDPSESAAAQVRFGEGYVGYIGDVNWEEGSILLLLAMLHVESPAPVTSSSSGKQSITTTSEKTSKSTPFTASGSQIKTSMLSTQSFEPTAERFVLLLALDGDIDESYKQPTLASLKAKSTLRIVGTAKETQTLLSSPDLGGVFVADAGITKRQYTQLLTQLVDYVKAGGSVVIGGSFSTFVKPSDMTTFFQRSWGVNWKPGSYHRTTFYVNSNNELGKSNPSLPSSYSMKALHVKDVLPDTMVYRPTSESRLESLVFAPGPVGNLSESPAVRTRVGKGFLAYIGDVNWEVGSAKFVLAALGLLDPPPTIQPKTPANHTPSLASDIPKTVPSIVKKPDPAPAASGSASKPPVNTPKAAPATMKSKLPVPSSLISKPIIMLLSLENEDLFATTYAHCLSTLRGSAETVQALSAPFALKTLDSPNLVGVFITDAGIVAPENAHVLSRLVKYVKCGGSIVVGGFFSSFVEVAAMNTFFKDAWGLPWKGGAYNRTVFTRSVSHEVIANNPSLIPSYSMKALHLKDLVASDVVYLPEVDLNAPVPITDQMESPVVQRKIGEGYFSYVGDVTPELETTNLVLAMLGLLDKPKTNPQPTATNAPELTKPNTTKPLKPDVAEPVIAKLAEPSQPSKLAKANGTAGIVNEPAPRVEEKKNKLASAGPTSRPFMMICSFGSERLFTGVQGDLLELLRSKLEVLHGLSNERVIELICSPDLVGIFITDAGIIDPDNAYLLSKLVEYTKNGGTVVFGSSFSSNIRFNEVETFFGNWDVPWKGGDYTRAEVTVNRKHALVQKNQSLPSTFTLKALHVTGITPDTAIYQPVKSQPASTQNPPQAPVVLAQVQKGRLGYIGDVGLQDEHSQIVLAMFGL